MSDKSRKFFQIEVPEEIHRLAKAEVAKSGRTLKEVLNELVEMWLRGEIKLESNEERSPKQI